MRFVSRMTRGELQSKTFAQDTGEFPQGSLISPVPHPLSELLGFHESSLAQDGHVMRNGGLGKVNALLDIGSAQPHFFADGTGSAFLEGLQNTAAGRVADRVQGTVQGLLSISHGTHKQ